MTINILPFTSRMQSTCSISGKPQVLNTIPLAYSPKYKIPAQTLFYHFPSDFHWQMVSPAEGFSAPPDMLVQPPDLHLSSFAPWLWDTENLPPFSSQSSSLPAISSLQRLTSFWVCSFNLSSLGLHPQQKVLEQVAFAFSHWSHLT